MCHMLGRTSLVRPSRAMALKSLIRQGFSLSEEWIKIRNNPGVLKIIENYPKRKNKSEDQRMWKGVNRNETRNTKLI